MKKNIINKYLGVVIIITAVMASCSKIGGINFSPNSPSEPQTALLITNAQRSSVPVLDRPWKSNTKDLTMFSIYQMLFTLRRPVIL